MRLFPLVFTLGLCLPVVFPRETDQVASLVFLVCRGCDGVPRCEARGPDTSVDLWEFSIEIWGVLLEKICRIGNGIG